MVKTRNRIRQSAPDRVFDFINTMLLVLILVIVAYPLLIIVSNSFSDPLAVTGGEVLLFPVRPTFNGYRVLFGQEQVFVGYANTILYTTTATLLGVVLTMLAAFPLSCPDLYGRNVIMGLFTFTMLFGGGLIPSYLLNRSLGFVNSRWSMIILGVFSVYNTIVARTFLQSNIPHALREAAALDGADDISYFLHIVLPLSKTILAVLTLFYAVGHWNSYSNALIYIRDEKLYPLQLVLRNILILSQIDDISELAGVDLNEVAKMQGLQDVIKYSLIIVASLPILILYPFLQKYFLKGVMIGSLKG